MKRADDTELRRAPAEYTILLVPRWGMALLPDSVIEVICCPKKSSTKVQQNVYMSHPITGLEFYLRR